MRLKLAVVLGVAWAAAIGTTAWAAVGNHFSPSETDVNVNKAISMLTSPDQTNRIPQAFGYDNDENVLYIAQIQQGSGHEVSGDLVVTKIDNSDTTNKLGYCLLKNFGHGAALGVEPFSGSTASPKNAWIWVEVAPQPDSAGNAYGTKIARLVCVPGNTYTYDKANNRITQYNSAGNRVDTTARFFDLAPGSTKVSATYDATSDRVAVRALVSGVWKYSVFSRTAIVPASVPLTTYGTQVTVSPTNLAVANLQAPAGGEHQSGLSFQGYTLYGDWIYTLVGNPYNPPDDTDKNLTAISAFSIDGAYKYVAKTPLDEYAYASSVGSAGNYFEPEGMAIRVLASGPRLRWGLAVYDSSSNRRLATFEKQTLYAPTHA